MINADLMSNLRKHKLGKTNSSLNNQSNQEISEIKCFVNLNSASFCICGLYSLFFDVQTTFFRGFSTHKGGS